MSLKDSLSEDEFKKLVERLSDRRNELEGRITINSVRDSLAELGLSHLLRENDLEEVSKQVSREFKKQQRQNYFNLALILIIIVAPLAAFGGYKLREYLIAGSPELTNEVPDRSLKLAELERKINELRTNQTELEAQLKDSKAEKDGLNETIEELTNENKVLNEAIEELTNENKALENLPETNSEYETSSDSTKTFRAQGIVYELRRCEKSNLNSNSQTVTCILSIISTKENVDLLLKYKTTRSRIFEAGREYLATRASLGGRRGGYDSARNSLIKNVPIEGIITFDEVSREVDRIEVLQIQSHLASSDYKNYLDIEFRNIPLSE